jgi:hypothetical protein
MGNTWAGDRVDTGSSAHISWQIVVGGIREDERITILLVFQTFCDSNYLHLWDYIRTNPLGKAGNSEAAHAAYDDIYLIKGNILLRVIKQLHVFRNMTLQGWMVAIVANAGNDPFV